MSQDAVRVTGLEVCLGAGASQVRCLNQAEFSAPAGAITCLVGASGSGKSLLLKSILGVLSDLPGVVAGALTLGLPGLGEVHPWEGLEGQVRRGPSGSRLLTSDWYVELNSRMAPLWGRYLGYVAQHGSLALDPTCRLGELLFLAIRCRNTELSRGQVREEAVSWLRRLELDRPEEVLRLYPGQLSGGMAQRAQLAVVLARGARLIFADEPTTGLDPEARESLLRLLATLQEKKAFDTLVLVTHDFGVARRLAQRVSVMAGGQVVEQLPAAQFFSEGPAHLEARRLLEQFDQLSHQRAMSGSLWARSRGADAVGGGDLAGLGRFPETKDASFLTQRQERVERGPASGQPDGSWQPRLEVSRLSVSYRHGTIFSRLRRTVLRDISLKIWPGEVVGIRGPSGQGKSTLAGALVGLLKAQGGQVHLNGRALLGLPRGPLRALRKQIQLLVQQPTAALHPRMRVEDGLRETATRLCGLRGADVELAVSEVMERVGLSARRRAFPAQLSGGELRRVGLGKVLLLEPSVLIADEPTAGVDASLRGALLMLLAGMTRGPGQTSILLISHDQDVHTFLADRILELRDGGLAACESRGEEP